MKIPNRWSPKTIKAAIEAGTEIREINGRPVRIVTDPTLELHLTSTPKNLIHRSVEIGPWHQGHELEVRLK
jgi:hypothetical protein